MEWPFSTLWRALWGPLPPWLTLKGYVELDRLRIKYVRRYAFGTKRPLLTLCYCHACSPGLHNSAFLKVMEWFCTSQAGKQHVTYPPPKGLAYHHSVLHLAERQIHTVEEGWEEDRQVTRKSKHANKQMRTHKYKALHCCCFCGETEPQTVFSAAKSPNNMPGQYGQLVYCGWFAKQLLQMLMAHYSPLNGSTPHRGTLLWLLPKSKLKLTLTLIVHTYVCT